MSIPQIGVTGPSGVRLNKGYQAYCAWCGWLGSVWSRISPSSTEMAMLAHWASDEWQTHIATKEHIATMEARSE